MSLEVNKQIPDPKFGLVILAGGRSSRFGADKVMLKFEGRTFLETLIHRFQPLQIPIVVAGKQPENFPDNLDSVAFVEDQQPDCGPLEGIRNGLALLEPLVEFAFVTSCDAPLVRADVARFLVSQIGSFQAVVPRSELNVYGMTAIYRTDVHALIESRISANQFRVRDFAGSLRTKFIDVEELRHVDPRLDSLINVNTPEEYRLLLEMPRAN